MGAAGLTCTTCEQAAAGGPSIGMDIDLAMVPLRETGMEPFEIMMSESQERMLAVVTAGREDELATIFRRWGQHAAVLGRVTDDGLLRVRVGEQIVAEMPAHSLADAPLYHLPATEPAYLAARNAFDFATVAAPAPGQCGPILLRLLAAPNIASKEWIYAQYDHSVQINTIVGPGHGDAAVLRIRESSTNKGIAAKTDCNARYCYLDPFMGAQIAVAECARNLVCVGAEPAGVTDCLCFGNPEKPDRFWQFKRAVEGIAAACRFFRMPVVSGNVSLYNETADSAIFPSPLIGVVGVLDDISKATGMAFANSGDLIILLGTCTGELGGSEYMATLHGLEEGRPPHLDLDREVRVQGVTLEAIREGLVNSAHDCSDGGLAVALAESCIAGNVGAHIELEADIEASRETRLDALLFGEAQSRIVLSVRPQHLPRLQALAHIAGIPLCRLGSVGGVRLTIADNRKGFLHPVIDAQVADLEATYRNAIARLMS
jgi:phosphoribosylformylglycinamidine synthase